MSIIKFNQLLNQHTGKLLGLGMAWLGRKFYRQWHDDKNEIAQKPFPAPVPPFTQWPSRPHVSLLVAAWNEEAYLEGFLDSFANLGYPNKELILVAGGSDKTVELAQKWAGPQIKVLQQIPGEGKFNALHRNLSQASGSVILLTDADCLLTSAHVERLIYPIISGKAQATTGPFRPLSSTQFAHPFIWVQWATISYSHRSFGSTQPYVPFMIGPNCAITRSLLEVCWAGIDRAPIELDRHLALSAQRMGQQILYVKGSDVNTDYHVSLLRYILQRSRWHRTSVILHYEFGDRRWIRIIQNSIKSTVMLCLLLLPLLLGPVGVVICILLWARSFRRYLHALLYFHRDEQSKLSSRHLWAAFKLMIADFIAWAIVPVQIAVPKWRTHWRLD